MDTLEQFCIDLVPKPLQHVQGVVNNQKYLVALAIRDLKGLKYEDKMDICNTLLKGVSVKGVVGVMYDIEDILFEVDKDKLELYLFGKET